MKRCQFTMLCIIIGVFILGIIFFFRTRKISENSAVMSKEIAELYSSSSVKLLSAFYIGQQIGLKGEVIIEKKSGTSEGYCKNKELPTELHIPQELEYAILFCNSNKK